MSEMMLSPKKGHPDNWLRVMGEAQSLGLITSATNVFGFGESYEDRIEHMDAFAIYKILVSKIIRVDLLHLLPGQFN